VEFLFIGPQLFLCGRRDEQVGRIGLIHKAVGHPSPVVSSFKSHDEVSFLKISIPCEQSHEVACLQDEQEGREGTQNQKEALESRRQG